MFFIKWIFYIIMALFCLGCDKYFRESAENKDLHNQIKYGIYLIIGIIVLMN